MTVRIYQEYLSATHACKQQNTHLALVVGERAEPDLLQRGRPRGRGVVHLPAEGVAPAPPGGRARRRAALWYKSGGA